MNSFQKNTLFLATLLLAIGAISAITYFKYEAHNREVEEQKMAWKKHNIRELKDLNKVGVLSTDEQTRLDNAGDDVDRIQQVLLDLHTERHTKWVSRMEEIQRQANLLSANSYLAAYDYSGQLRQAGVDLRHQRVEAQENLDAYELGFKSIRAWRPISFDQFQKITPVDQDHETVQLRDSAAKPQAGISGQFTSVVNQPSLGSVVTSPTAAQSALDNVDVEVLAALHNWSLAMVSNDPEEIASCYGKHVDRYFLKLDLSKDAVREYMREWSNGGTKTISGFSTKDVTFENETADTAKIRLVKDMTIVDSSGTNEHLIRSRLYLRLEDGSWKITSEQDFK